MIEADKIIQDDSEIANIFNDFFSKAIVLLNINIPSEYITDINICTDDVIDDIILKFSNHPSIKLINDNVIKGHFSFSLVNITDVESVCCKPLTNIINNGIVNSIFDSGLNRADISPVHKMDETINKSNYRNISLLPVVSKIYEKILQGQISAYMESYLSPFLCGYRKGFNPQHALLSMLEKWRVALDKGGYGGGVLMDLSKAFDTINHDLLIAKICVWI